MIKELIIKALKYPFKYSYVYSQKLIRPIKQKLRPLKQKLVTKRASLTYDQERALRKDIMAIYTNEYLVPSDNIDFKNS